MDKWSGAHYKVLSEITYPCINVIYFTAEIWVKDKYYSFISHLIMGVITYTCCEYS